MKAQQCQKRWVVSFSLLITIAGGPWTSHLTSTSQVCSSGYEMRGWSKASSCSESDSMYKAKFCFVLFLNYWAAVFFFKCIYFIYFIFGCVGCSLLLTGFL